MPHNWKNYVILALKMIKYPNPIIKKGGKKSKELQTNPLVMFIPGKIIQQKRNLEKCGVWPIKNKSSKD